MKNVIYLVGQISKNTTETYQWRDNVVDFFKEDEEFHIINPCSNRFNDHIKNNSGGDPSSVYDSTHTNILVPKDRSYVKESNIAIANMQVYDKEKLIIGSFFELSWYYDDPTKTVIGIHPSHRDDVICQNPFVRETITTWVKNEYNACDLIKYMF